MEKINHFAGELQLPAKVCNLRFEVRAAELLSPKRHDETVGRLTIGLLQDNSLDLLPLTTTTSGASPQGRRRHTLKC